MTHDMTAHDAAAHLDDQVVDQLAAALKQKLARSRAKGRGGWNDKEKCPPGRLQEMMAHHIGKGDPLDVAAFAMMLWYRGEDTRSAYGSVQTLPRFDLNEEQAGLLRWLIGEDGDPSEVTISVGEISEDGKVEFGLRAHQTEYPDEGAVMLCELPRTPASVTAFNQLPFVLEKRGNRWVKLWGSPQDIAAGKTSDTAMVATASEIALWAVLQATGVTDSARACAASAPVTAA